jgi:hypothetical protein
VNAPPNGYVAFADAVRGGGILSDPWYDGAPRFREEPLVLSRAAARSLAAVAEGFAAAHQRLTEIVRDEPSLLDAFFGLTPCQKLMFWSSAPRWHGIARVDLFLTAEGPRACEMNSDTPSGEPEAVILARRAQTSRPDLLDPNAGFEARFAALIARAAASIGRRGAPRVGVVYPTEMPEDLAMIRLYRDALAAAGMRAVLGSPFNLALGRDGTLTLFGDPIDVLVRHYKTDWWGERRTG